MKIFQGYDANFGADEQYPFRRGAGACVPSGNEAARRGRSPAPASVYTKSCPLSSLRGERGKPRHECTKPGAQTVKFFARNREVVTRLRRVRYGKSRPVREERRVG